MSKKNSQCDNELFIRAIREVVLGLRSQQDWSKWNFDGDTRGPLLAAKDGYTSAIADVINALSKIEGD